MLLLIHKEECPFCAKVRSFLSQNQISYISLVSPSNSKSRPILKKLGGQDQIPFLIDFDQGISIYESSDIIAYLEKNYI